MSGEVLSPCSDDESYGLTEDGSIKKWLPPREDIIALYKVLNEGNVPTLQWVCPGRRDPHVLEEEAAESEEEERAEEKSDFDFADEPSAPRLGGPRRTQSNQSGPRGSAKKKTTSLDGVLSSIMKYRKLEAMEKKGPKKVNTPSVPSTTNIPPQPSQTQQNSTPQT